MSDELLLHVSAVPVWLATINLGDVRKPEARARLAAFQEECARVLAERGLTLAKPGLEGRDALYTHVKATWPGGVKGLLEDLCGGPMVRMRIAPGQDVLLPGAKSDPEGES